jgi:hypothetical protein
MKNKNAYWLALLFLLLVIPLLDFFHIGLPLTHDGQDHVARIANFYQNLSEGNIIPRWAGNLNWGYGHPILEFLYPLPSYFASFFHFLGFTLVDSVKLVFGTSFILSGLTMYIFIKELLKDSRAAFFAGILYAIAPYRFVDLYVRGAIGEHVVFIFPPLIFYFLTKLSNKFSSWYVLGGSLSFAGLVLAHNAIALMFLPIIFAYAIYLFFQCADRKHFVFNVLSLIIIGFGLSAFFWIPAFFEGKYTLRDIVTGGGEYLKSFVSWKDFFVSPWDYGGTAFLSKQIGFIHWIAVLGGIFSAVNLHRKKNKLWIIYLGSFLIFWIALFLMTSSSDFIWQKITILQKFQFPWRFLSVNVFLSALMGGIFLFLIPKKFKGVFLLLLVAGLLMVNRNYWHASEFLQKGESFYNGVYDGTTDTGESAPIWSVRFMEKRAKENVQIVEGQGKVKEIYRNFTRREYRTEAEGKIRILENTLYFPGWTVLIDGRSEIIEFQDQAYRGLITFEVDRGNHKIDIIYKETKVRLFADIVSFASLLMVGGFVFFSHKASRKKL